MEMQRENISGKFTPVFRSTVNQFGINIRFDRRLISSS